MLHIQSQKRVIVLRPQLKNDGDFANNAYVDTSGRGHVRFEFYVGDTDADVGSTDEATAPKIEECDTSGGSYSDVSSAELSAVISATDDNKIYAIDISLLKTHKRYMRVKAPHAAAGSTGANLCIVAILSQPSIAPVDAAGQGLEEHVKV